MSAPRRWSRGLAWLFVPCLFPAGCLSPGDQRAPAERPITVANVKAQLEGAYTRNRQAFLAKDVSAVMALRTPDFHSITPDGARHDRQAMEGYTKNFLGGVDRWIDLSFEIEALEVAGPEARAQVRQHAVRRQLRADNKIHHVETWVTQRETWRLTNDGWKLARVDQVRDQRRLVDGQPG